MLISRNETDRGAWLRKTLSEVPAGWRLLDAGAGELRNRPHCAHLEYVSQDFCQYGGAAAPGAVQAGLQNPTWDTSRIDLVSDIAAIPAPDASFDAILCSEVLEHVPDPNLALDEFARLLKPGGRLILTAPFASMVHQAPYHFCTGFSRYWYEHHLGRRGFDIVELTPNGDWYDYLRQEVCRLPIMERKRGHWAWPIALLCALPMLGYHRIRSRASAADFGCFGFHCVATKGIGRPRT